MFFGGGHTNLDPPVGSAGSCFAQHSTILEHHDPQRTAQDILQRPTFRPGRLVIKRLREKWPIAQHQRVPVWERINGSSAVCTNRCGKYRVKPSYLGLGGSMSHSESSGQQPMPT